MKRPTRYILFSYIGEQALTQQFKYQNAAEFIVRSYMADSGAITKLRLEKVKGRSSITVLKSWEKTPDGWHETTPKA